MDKSERIAQFVNEYYYGAGTRKGKQAPMDREDLMRAIARWEKADPWGDGTPSKDAVSKQIDRALSSGAIASDSPGQYMPSAVVQARQEEQERDYRHNVDRVLRNIQEHNWHWLTAEDLDLPEVQEWLANRQFQFRSGETVPALEYANRQLSNKIAQVSV